MGSDRSANDSDIGNYPGEFCDVDIIDRIVDGGVCIKYNMDAVGIRLCAEGKRKHTECVIASIRGGDVFSLKCYRCRGGKMTGLIDDPCLACDGKGYSNLYVVNEATLRDGLREILEKPCKKEHTSREAFDEWSVMIWVWCGSEEIARIVFPKKTEEATKNWWGKFVMEKHNADVLPDQITELIHKASIRHVD